MFKDILVPDIGGAENVDVIEVAVKPGDKVAAEDTLITLESDKATMDIPAPEAGVVKQVQVKVGDKVSEGVVILSLEGEQAKAATPEAPIEKTKSSEQTAPTNATGVIEVKLPNIGTEEAVTIIEIAVSSGDELKVDAPLLTLESDKATMDVPSPVAGKLIELKVKVGDKVKEGDLIALVTAQTSETTANVSPQPSTANEIPPAQPTPTPAVQEASVASNGSNVHAGPAVRRLANQLGVDLSRITATGRKGRILPEDVHQFVKSALQQTSAGGTGINLAPAPKVDFAKFGEIELAPLTRIKKLTGANMSRNWVTVPHVTQFDEADITDMEAFRQENKKAIEQAGGRLTPLVFIMKAVVSALKTYPQFNASLDALGENLVMKKYFHIGVAVDTPNGLVVPVFRDVDQKTITELSVELIAISKKAREGKLMPNDMQGGCFTISSLGGIGGTAFTPIVNSPEVAILGVSKSQIKPQWQGSEFQPRLMLPLSLSYDHRVIDGADGARFSAHLVKVLSDLRQLLL